MVDELFLSDSTISSFQKNRAHKVFGTLRVSKLTSEQVFVP